MVAMRRLKSIFLALTGCLAGLASAQNASQQIVIWGRALGPDQKGLERVIREFEGRNPGTKVRVLGMGAGEMNPQKLMTAIVGNVAPDAVYQDRFTISDWASRGAFLNLDDYLKRDASDPLCPKKDDYYPATWNEVVYDNKVYGIPTGCDDRVLYYNKEIFFRHAAELKAAGLDPNRPPQTWSEILKYSEILTERNPDGSLKCAGFLPNFGNSWLYLYAFQNNAAFLSPDGRKCTLNTPESLEALKFMIDGYKIVDGYAKAKAFEQGFQADANDAFIIGKVAMKIDGDWIINNLARYAPNLDFATAPAPSPDDRVAGKGRFQGEKDKFITWSGGFSYAIPRGARNPELAWKFIKFATSLEGRRIEHLGQRDAERRAGRTYVPRLAASKSGNDLILKEFMPADPRMAGALRQHIEMIPFAKFRPVTFAGQVLWDAHVKAIENACLGENPSTALANSQKDVQRELDAVFDQEKHPKVNLNIAVYLGLGLLALLVGLAVRTYQKARMGNLAKTESKWAYLFISPWVIGFVVFTLGPMIASLFFSLTQYNVLQDARWVGTQNYQDLFGADFDRVKAAFLNAAYLGGLGVPLGICTGLAIAVLLNSAAKGLRFYRTAFYVPSIFPVVASAVLWSFVLNPDPAKGLFNAFWKVTLGAWLKIDPPGWLTDPAYTKQSLIIMGLWGAGGGMLLWLAGLKGVPKTLYEAAEIDGASPRQQFWKVTLPQLSSLIFFNSIVGLIGAMQEFERIYILANGTSGPNDSLLSPAMHLFNNGFKYFKMGYASALAWLIFLVIAVLTFIQFRVSRKLVYYESER